MHRISCFRDDAVFIVYLYQRWAYRVDNTRGMWATEAKDNKKKVKADEDEKSTKAIEEAKAEQEDDNTTEQTEAVEEVKVEKQ